MSEDEDARREVLRVREQSRRLRRHPVGAYDLFESFRAAGSRWPTHVVITEFEGVPPDARVVSVLQKYDPFTLEFILEHESFGEVAPGEEVPRGPLLNRRMVQLIADEGGARLIDHLQAEVNELRGLFGDLRLDQPKIDAAYRRGLEDAAREIERERGEGKHPIIAVDVPELARLVRGLADRREATE